MCRFLTLLVVFILEVTVALPAKGQLVQEFKPPKADCCLQILAQRLAEDLQDWNQLGRYHE